MEKLAHISQKRAFDSIPAVLSFHKTSKQSKTGHKTWTRYTDLKIVVFCSGAIIMVLEILGFRILAPFFGYSVYVSGSLIGIVMVALSLGYYLGGQLADRKPEKPILFQLILIADIYIITMSFLYTNLIGSLSTLGVIYGSILSSVILFCPSMILLGMVPPFIIKLMAKDTSIIGSVAGDITAIGTIGSIAGTFGATFFLIPAVGSHWTMYICSIVLLLVAVWGLSMQKKKYIFLLVMVSIFNIFPEQSEPNTIYKKESLYNLIKVTQNTDGGLLLKLNSDMWVHSIYRPDSRLVYDYFDYLNVVPIIADAHDILILGMGAGTSAKQYLHYFDTNIDAVELDPGVIEVGKKYFGLTESDRFHIYAEDARPFLRTAGKMYDVISIDIYHGGVYAPFYVLTKEFFASVYDHLTPNGVMVINVISPYEQKNRTLLVDAVGNTISTVFPSTYKIELFLNHILFATKSGTSLNTIKNRLYAYQGDRELRKLVLSVVNDISYFQAGNSSIVLTDDKSPVAELTYEMMSGVYNDPHYMN